jgi:hypothetical protein
MEIVKWTPRMRCVTARLLQVLALLICLAGHVSAQGMNAFAALQLLPKAALPNLVQIEAYDGNPTPDRWYFLVYDATAPAGLREFTVENGKLISDRTISQLATSLKPGDVIGAKSVVVDSDYALKICDRFLAINKVRPGVFDYKLVRNESPAVPVWQITCIDTNGDQTGTVIVNAVDGSLVVHTGFAAAPDLSDLITAAPAPPVEGSTAPPAPTKPFLPTTRTTTKRTSPPPPKPKPEEKPSGRAKFKDSVKKLFGGSD